MAAGESRPRWEHMLKWPGISRRQDCDRPGFWPWSVGLEPIEGRRTAESAASGSTSAQTLLTVPARHSSPTRDTAAVLQSSCCKLQRTEGPGAARGWGDTGRGGGAPRPSSWGGGSSVPARPAPGTCALAVAEKLGRRCARGLICFNRVQRFETPWTVARQAPLSVRFSRHEDWSGVAMPASRASS